MTTALICLLFALIIGGNVVIGALHRTARRRAEEIRRREIIRAGFAEARTQIIWATLQGELDPASATFRHLYFITTAAMRRDDQYDDLWQEVLLDLQRSSEDKSGIKQEAPAWSPQVRGAVLQFVKALDVLLIEHSSVLRWLHRLLRWTSKAPHLPFSTWLSRFFTQVRQEEERQRKLAAAREVESLLKGVAGCAA
jgi:hypothetical protein